MNAQDEFEKWWKSADFESLSYPNEFALEGFMAAWDIQQKRIDELSELLSEAIDLMEDTRNGEYKPDSLTTQPWRLALQQPLPEYG